VAVFFYVDNSNVWIEGMRVSAVNKGMASSIHDAMDRRITDHSWRYDFGRLYRLACPETAKVGRSVLVGSRPPPNDSLWDIARTEGFEVITHDRNRANKEKKVDSTIVTLMMEDSYEYMRAERHDRAVLAAGDSDFVPQVESLTRRGLEVWVMFWNHASRELRDTCTRFLPLDPQIDFLAGKSDRPVGLPSSS
jgi:hypothetical protein